MSFFSNYLEVFGSHFALILLLLLPTMCSYAQGCKIQKQSVAFERQKNLKNYKLPT